MASNLSISPGKHCETHSFTWIAECLDDGTGRLLRKTGAFVSDLGVQRDGTASVEY